MLSFEQAIAAAGEFLATHDYTSMSRPVKAPDGKLFVRVFRHDTTIGVGRADTEAEAVNLAIAAARSSLLGSGARWCS